MVRIPEPRTSREYSKNGAKTAGAKKPLALQGLTQVDPKSPEQWAKLERLLDELLDLSVEERSAFLEQECTDPLLRAEVEQLLASCAEAELFLESPAAEFVSLLVGARGGVPDELTSGARLASYEITRVIGRGGMGVVYLAQDSRLNRPIALKVLDPELAAWLGPDRFLREITIATQLSHPHILPVYDSGTAQGLLFYVTPYVEGESLGDRLRREKCLRDIAAALAYAHARGVIHRDVKPDNILLAGYPPLQGAAGWSALLADFGIARATGPNEEPVTGPGLVPGTPAYMSPEQARGGQPLDGRSDIYSLGCVAFEMLCGEPPAGSGETIRARLRRAGSAALAAVVEKALAVHPADRFQSAAEFVTALDSLSGRGRRTWPRQARWAAAAAGLLLLAIVAGIRSPMAF